MNHSKSTPNIFLERKPISQNIHNADLPRMADDSSTKHSTRLSYRMSFESSISTTSTSKIHATSIFSSSNGNASDGDDEEEDFLYYSSATDQDIPQRTFTLPFATGLKRKYSHRSIGSHTFFKKKSSNGSIGIRTKAGSLSLAPHPFPPRDSDPKINSTSTLEISEETRLLDNPDVEQGMNQEKIQKKSSMILIVSTIALSLTLLAAILLVTFSLQPLQLTGVTDMKVITRTVHLFELNIFLEGFNPNIVSINLNETDLDIYASRGINTLLQIPNLDPQPAVINTVTRPTEEILGHIRSFNSSIDDLTFKPLSNQSLGPKISIIDPSNTIGRFIYMTFPFTIIIRGDISYNSPLDLMKSTIPVCMYQHLLSENEVSTYSCL